MRQPKPLNAGLLAANLAATLDYESARAMVEDGPYWQEFTEVLRALASDRVANATLVQPRPVSHEPYDAEDRERRVDAMHAREEWNQRQAEKARGQL